MQAFARAVALASSCCVLAVSGTGIANAAWAPVGSNSVSQGDVVSGHPSLAAIGGVPYVAWYAPGDGGNSDIFVSRLDAAGDWNRVGAASRIEESPDGYAFQPNLVNIGDVPYVAFVEWDGTNDELRVSRLDGDEWEQPVGGASPINDATDRDSFTPSLASIGGVPYVAWSETNSDFSGQNLWVSRLNPEGTAWERVGGDSPINSPGFEVNGLTLAVIDGVPWVAWAEQRGLESEIRVARLKADGSGWEEVAGGPQPIKHGAAAITSHPSLVPISGVPYVAWSESTGLDGHDVRVSRLNAAGTAWKEVGGALDHTAGDDSFQPRMTSIDGVPYVAWTETDSPPSGEARISRLNAAGTAWKEVVGGPSPIPHAPDARMTSPSPTVIGGVPYVASLEEAPHSGGLRVSRLEPEFLDQAALATDGEALVLSKVRTYGAAYPIAFQYGPAPALGEQTGTSRTAYDSDVDIVFRVLPRLTPDTDYLWRPIGFDGIRATGLGPLDAFTTRRAFTPRRTRLLIALLRSRLEVLSGRSLTVRYLVTRRARVTLSVLRGGKLAATARGRAHAGRNRITWDGRIDGRRPRPGRYTLVIEARRADGQTARDRARLRISRRSVGSRQQR
jgi:hypothetical protein